MPGRAQFLDRRSRVRLAERMASPYLLELGLPQEGNRSSEGYLVDLLRSALAPERETPQEPSGPEAGQYPIPSWRSPA